MTYRAFTLVIPYYDNPDMFREQQRIWRSLSPDLREALHVIVVDDGSPRWPANDAIDPATRKSLKSFRVFRANVDIRWNWIFCRNLGVEHATTEWVLMTDIDHVIPQATWRRLMRGKLDPLCAYRLSRVKAPEMTPHNPHPNTWVMTKHMFINRIGGYDERFSGVYGSDGQFHKRVDAWARAVHILTEHAVLYDETIIADACTTTYERKTDQDRERRAAIKAEIASFATGYSPKRLTFPWDQVY